MSLAHLRVEDRDFAGDNRAVTDKSRVFKVFLLTVLDVENPRGLLDLDLFLDLLFQGTGEGYVLTIVILLQGKPRFALVKSTLSRLIQIQVDLPLLLASKVIRFDQFSP